MFNLFLEDGDLLEAVEIMNLLNEEVIIETTIAGMKVDKEKLEDEKYVKELIKKIKEENKNQNPKSARNKISGLLALISMISMITIVGIPIGALLLVISFVIMEKDHTDKDLEKLDDCIEKTIKKLKQRMKVSKNKDEYNEIINKLEDNKINSR